MAGRERRERQKESLRREILDAARELFIRDGYENVSMRRIAEKIDYSPTTIYLYFEDKADLLFSICEETFSRLGTRLEAITQAESDPVESLRKGMRAYIEFGLEYPNHYKVTFINHPQVDHGAEHYLRQDSMGMKAFNYLCQGVAGCIEANQFKETDVQLVSQTFWAGIHGITALLITKPGFPWKDKNRVIDLMLDTLIQGMRR